MDEPRHATKEAGELAGLNVLRIVNEPTAAAYAYGLLQDEPDKERLVMVYDLGGGTFDVTVLKMLGGSVEVIGTGGDPELGGSNFDDRIVDWMEEQLEETDPEFLASLSEAGMEMLRTRLKFHAEEGKMILCGPPERDAHHFAIAQIGTYEGRPVAFEGTLTMEEFERRIEDLMQNSLSHLDEAMKVPKEKHKYTEEHLTDILLVGGSTRVPYVRRLLEERYPHVPLRGLASGINPDEIVARGASIVAAQVDPDSEEWVDTQLIDVTGHTLSVAVFDERLRREILFPLIPKETPIPTSAKHRFYCEWRAPPIAKVRIYQGEGEEITTEVMMIGEFIIEIQPRPEPAPVEIGLELDASGLLIAHATDLMTQRQVKCEISYKDSTQLPKEELDRKRAALEAMMKQRMTRSENTLNILRGSLHVPTDRVDIVHFSVTSPPVVCPGTPFLIDVWAHLEEQRSAVIRRAQEATRETRVGIKSKGPVQVARGTSLSVRLELQDLVVEDPEDDILWTGDIGTASFAVMVPEDLKPGPRRGLTRVYVNGMQIARLYFEILVGDRHSDSQPLAAKEERLKKAFASYSSADLDAVLARVHGMEKAAPHLDVFIDILSLRSGQYWEQELMKRIPASDVFYLFWSEHARRSEWVEKEWRYALVSKGIDFIDPVPLVSPQIATPPPELKALHFNDRYLAFMRWRENG
jgi:molecular chaperone DnaK (HSP70)